MQEIENNMIALLSQLGADLSGKLRRAYEEARERIFDDVVLGIIRAEPNFTDHGKPHIKDVLNKSWDVLGRNFDSISPMDAYILCTSILFHDVGNYFGRTEHNKNIHHIYNYVRTGSIDNFPDDWSDEYSVVSTVVKAHSGRNASGGCDTLVDVGPDGYCHGKEIKQRDIAAIVRFSDELAQGRVRTSSFRLQTDQLLPPESELHHRYEISVKPTIDRGNGRIIMLYTFKVKMESEHLIIENTNIHFNTYYEFVLNRLNKLNAERKYSAYYCKHIEPFKNLQCNFRFINNGIPLETAFDRIELTDLVHPDGTHVAKLEEFNVQYSVGNITNAIAAQLRGA